MLIIRIVILLVLISFFRVKESFAQQSNVVKITGEMRNVMQKGQLYATINLDTISDKKHLYGLGPVENLLGELLTIDGRSYVSTVTSDSTMKVEETFKIGAPFYGYANISNWKEQTIPDSILTIQSLEGYLDVLSKADDKPYIFKLIGTVESAKIHVVNLPKGEQVNSPSDTQKGQVSYRIQNEEVEIIGFFSRQHQSIFTHHDTYLHLHLITKDRLKMGHLDELLLKKQSSKLYLPIQ